MNSEKSDFTKDDSAVIGEVTSGSLHSLKNYLQGIIGLAEILDANPDLPKESRMDIKVILDIAEDATKLVNQMRAVVKKKEIPVIDSSSIQKVEVTARKRSDTTILVVDDDPLVLRVITGMLKALGYGVLSTNDGQEAFDKYVESPEDISLVLADLDMPRVSGLKLAELLLNENANLKIVVMTGYIHEELEINPDEFGLAAWLEKPMTAAKLESVLVSILGI